MSWNQWQPPPSMATQADPNAAMATQMAQMNSSYTPEQWQQMQQQQQNWQQWAQWQQQYQQWQQQYGEQYKQMTALSQQAAQPPIPTSSTPIRPPLPKEPKPPLPPDDPPPPKTFPAYSAPPPTTPSYSTAPPTPSYSSAPITTSSYSNAPPLPTTASNQWNKQHGNNRPPLPTSNPTWNETSGAKQMTQPPPTIITVQKPQDLMSKRPPVKINILDVKKIAAPLIIKSEPTWQSPVKSPAVSEKSESLAELSETEKKFMKQFADWEAQFNKWKAQNQDHPDKEQYRQYEKKWETWRNQLLERREQMRKKRVSAQALVGKPQEVVKTEEVVVKTPVNQPDFTKNPPPVLESSKTVPEVARNPSLQLQQTPFQSNPASSTLTMDFKKPPPNLNDEPLQFKPSLNSTMNHPVLEDMDAPSDFLKAPPSGGIPGLDLVLAKSSTEEEDKPALGLPDFDALSKNINSILGDTKLLSMLSMVTKNQPIKLDDGEEQWKKNNEGVSEVKGDVWRNSEVQGDVPDFATKPPEIVHQDFNVKPPDFGRASQSFGNFGGPGTSVDFNTLPPNMNKPGGNFNKPGDNFNNPGGNFSNSGDSFNNPGGNFNHSGEFQGNFGTNSNKSSSFGQSPVKPIEDFNKFGQNNKPGQDFNNFNNKPGDNRNSGPGFQQFGPNSNNSHQNNPDNYNSQFGDGPNRQFNRDGNNFNQGNQNFGRGGNFNEDKGFNNRGSNNFNDPKNTNNTPSPNLNNRPPDFRENPNNHPGSNRNDFSDGPNRNNKQNVPFPGRNNENNRPKDGPSNFNRGPNNFPPNQNNRENFNNPDNRFGGKKNEFNRFNSNEEFNNDFNNQNENFRNNANYEEFNMETDNYEEEYNENDDYNEDPFAERENVEPEVVSQDKPEVESEEVVKEEDLWNATLVDYDHKSLKQSEPEVMIEPLQAFDYRHRPVNRIPYPERPRWLANILKTVREFEPAIGRPIPGTSGNNAAYFSRFPPQGGNNTNMPPQNNRFDPMNRPAPGNLAQYQNKPGDKIEFSRNRYDSPVGGRPLFPVKKPQFNQRDVPNIQESFQPINSPDSFGNREEDCDEDYEPENKYLKGDQDRDWQAGPFSDNNRDDSNRESDVNRSDFNREENWKRDQKSDFNRDKKPDFNREQHPDFNRDQHPDFSRDQHPDFNRGPNRDFNREPNRDFNREPNRDFNPDVQNRDFNRNQNRPNLSDSQKSNRLPNNHFNSKFNQPGLYDPIDSNPDVYNKPILRTNVYDNNPRGGGGGGGGNNNMSRRNEDIYNPRRDLPGGPNNSGPSNSGPSNSGPSSNSGVTKDAPIFDDLPQKSAGSSSSSSEISRMFAKGPKDSASQVTSIRDVIDVPGRYTRAPRIVIILRGPPGSGKTYLAKLIKDTELEHGNSAPRILSLDDYFMVEQETEVMEEGKTVKRKDMVYEFEEGMEESYRLSLLKAFKKTVLDGYFPFIIVDNVNDKVKYFGEMWSFAKQNGFQVYVCQMELDVSLCTRRNIHNRSTAQIERIVAGWEKTPAHHPVMDAAPMLKDGSIPCIDMEEVNSPPDDEAMKGDDDDDEDDACRSKWDTFDCSNLAKLDGISKPLRAGGTMEDYLQLDDQWVQPESVPGKKRVRWADLEENRSQEKMRAIGFVVGQTDWSRMMDPTKGGSALTRTKFIERTSRYKLNN